MERFKSSAAAATAIANFVCFSHVVEVFALLLYSVVQQQLEQGRLRKCERFKVNVKVSVRPQEQF